MWEVDGGRDTGRMASSRRGGWLGAWNERERCGRGRGEARLGDPEVVGMVDGVMGRVDALYGRLLAVMASR